MIDYEKLLAALVRGKVEFIIVGGVAAVVHGSARLTQDLDIVYGRSDDNLENLFEALKDRRPYPRGAPPDLPFRWEVQTLRSGLNFTLTTSMGDLDLFGELAGGGSYEDLAHHVITVQLFGFAVNVLDLPELIRVKKAAGRPKDLEAIAELEAIEEMESNAE